MAPLPTKALCGTPSSIAAAGLAATTRPSARTSITPSCMSYTISRFTSCCRRSSRSRASVRRSCAIWRCDRPYIISAAIM